MTNIRKIIPGIPKNFPVAAEKELSADKCPPPPPGSGKILAADDDQFVG